MTLKILTSLSHFVQKWIKQKAKISILVFYSKKNLQGINDFGDFHDFRLK